MGSKDNTKQTLIDLTTELMSYPSVVDDLSSKKGVMEAAGERLNLSGVTKKSFTSRGLPSAVFSFRGDDRPKVMLNGHLDVVPAPDKDFKPKIKGDRLYGRGSGDMKAGCAVMMEVMRYFASKKKRPSLGLMLTTDEESGGFNGTGHLLEKKGYLPQVAVIPDGGVDLSTLAINEKGVLHIKIKAKGKSAHGSRPFLGENAIDKLLDIYTQLRREFPHIKQNEWKNSLNLGRIQGGEATNKVPDHAEMQLDIRYTREEDREEILDKIRRFTHDFEVLAGGPPFIQDPGDPYVAEYVDSLKGRISKEISYHRSEGASDARFFTEKGVTVISTKINCANIHSDNEWVDIKEMRVFYDVLIDYINKAGY